jgi:hypothetical protein
MRDGGGGGHTCFGLENGLRKIFSQTVFLFLSKHFTVNKQTFSVDFGFTAKQMPVNDENVLRKIFYVETNGAGVKNIFDLYV